ARSLPGKPTAAAPIARLRAESGRRHMAALAPPPGREAAAAGTAGGGLAEGLVSAVEAGVGPEQDVAAYLRHSLLPVLGPAIEQLLHHIHDSGELQRALKELAAAEKQRSQRKTAQASEAAADRAAAEDRAALDGSPPEEAAATGEKGGSPRTSKGRRSSRGDASARPNSKGRQSQEPPPQEEKEEEVELFDPLVWLSERLRESAAGPTELYRERIEQRVIQHILRVREGDPRRQRGGGRRCQPRAAEAPRRGGARRWTGARRPLGRASWDGQEPPWAGAVVRLGVPCPHRGCGLRGATSALPDRDWRGSWQHSLDTWYFCRQQRAMVRAVPVRVLSLSGKTILASHFHPDWALGQLGPLVEGTLLHRVPGATEEHEVRLLVGPSAAGEVLPHPAEALDADTSVAQIAGRFPGRGSVTLVAVVCHNANRMEEFERDAQQLVEMTPELFQDERIQEWAIAFYRLVDTYQASLERLLHRAVNDTTHGTPIAHDSLPRALELVRQVAWDIREVLPGHAPRHAFFAVSEALWVALFSGSLRTAA
ncbi:unnamed protein product, partial [Prorocentrum cordatum]